MVAVERNEAAHCATPDGAHLAEGGIIDTLAGWCRPLLRSKMKLTTLVLASAVALGTAWAQAQTPPAKPAAKPAAKAAAKPAAKAGAEGKTLQMGGSGTTSGPILTLSLIHI